MRNRFLAFPIASQLPANPGRVRRVKKRFQQISLDIPYKVRLERAMKVNSLQYLRYCITLRVAKILLERLQSQGQIGIGWGFELDIDSTYVPDLIYVSLANSGRRQNNNGFQPNTVCSLLPTLAVEIVNLPSRSLAQLISKAERYLVAGVQQVWIIDPQSQTLMVLHTDRSMEVFKSSMTVINELFPGQEFVVDRLFT
jgi:Uma2 family endonuclease